jgi:hypothetical protein
MFLLVGLLPWLAAANPAPQPAAPSGSDAQQTSDALLTDPFSYRYGCYRPQISLDGEWQFQRDKENRGTELGYHQGRADFADKINIPGVPQAQGLGEPNQWQKWHLNEPFWVRRTFTLPNVTASQRIWLRLGGVLPAAEIFLNGTRVGYTKSSRTQQRVDVTALAKSDAQNLIAIKVCDWPEVKLEGIWEMAELRRVWTGVYRSVRLELTDPVCIRDAYVQPHLGTGSAKVNFELTAPSPVELEADMAVRSGHHELGATRIKIPVGATSAQAEVKLARFTPWSPNHPQLYMLDIALRRGRRRAPFDQVGIRFGMREIATSGPKFLLNGQPIYLRCTGDDQLYLETLAPPADPNWYLPRFQRAREYGINAAKSCEEIFSQDYLEAADEAGIMIIQEMPFGLSGQVRVTQNKLAEPWRRLYANEFVGLCKQSRNNASLIAYSMCSEVPLESGTQEAFDLFVRALPGKSRELAPHALVIDCTGWLGTTRTKLGARQSDFYAVIIPTWSKQVLNETPVKTDGLRPCLLHEYNWWSCYPDPLSRPKYRQAAIFPWWLDTLENSARARGQLDLVPTYVQNSLRLQALCRKDGLEYARRCPNVEGFILWLLIDFGQYTEGLLDDFWQPKNVSAKEFLRSAGDTVIVLAKEGNRTLRMGETVRIPLAVSHYGEADLDGSILKWKAGQGGRVLNSGQLKLASIPRGRLTEAGDAVVIPPPANTGYQTELVAWLEHRGRVVNTNHWSFWAFAEPAENVRALGRAENAGKIVANGVFLRLKPVRAAAIPAAAKLVLADGADAELADYIERGGRCVLLTRRAVIEQDKVYTPDANFYTQFRTIPWNAGPGNSGSVVSPHPLWADFPCDTMCDLQFLRAIQGVIPMNFEPLRPYGVKPIIRMIDFYQNNANNAHLLEFGVGQGKVLVTSLNLIPNLDHLEVRNLMASLLRYASSSRFTPRAQVPREEFLRLFQPRPDASKPGR